MCSTETAGKWWRLLHGVCIASLIAGAVGALALGVSSMVYPIYDADPLFNIYLSQGDDPALSRPRFWMTAESGVARFKIGYEKLIEKRAFQGGPVEKVGFKYLSFEWTSFPGAKTEYVYCVCTVSLWILVPLLGFYPLVWFIRGPFRRELRKHSGQCVRCGYNLYGKRGGAVSGMWASSPGKFKVSECGYGIAPFVEC